MIWLIAPTFTVANYYVIIDLNMPPLQHNRQVIWCGPDTKRLRGRRWQEGDRVVCVAEDLVRIGELTKILETMLMCQVPKELLGL
jgi:hypothetical protein